jgi:transcriptional regulator of arginine metabolism
MAINTTASSSSLEPTGSSQRGPSSLAAGLGLHGPSRIPWARGIRPIGGVPIDSVCIFMQDACDFMQESEMLRSEPEHPAAPARRTLLAKIIREQTVGRQTELVDLLRKLGHIATQSSVSRDLRELGVAKMGDRYVLPETAMQPKNDFSALKQFVGARLTAGTNLTVLKTAIGSAQSVAVAIDTAQWPEVVGTISGDDTIFIATAGAAEQRKLERRLLAIFGR